MKIISYDDLQQAEMVLSFGKQKMTVSVFMIDGLLIDTGPVKMKENSYPCLNSGI